MRHSASMTEKDNELVSPERFSNQIGILDI